MGRYGNLNYARLAKRGFLLGAALFALGVAGEILGRALAGGLPGWEDVLFVSAIYLGIAVGFVAVFSFGIVLPLTE
jgi:hypothetical protein